MSSSIKALSFDLWDTLLIDDSDERKRKALGKRSKHDERRYLVWQAIDQYTRIKLNDVVLAYDVVDTAFSEMWREMYVTWPLRKRLQILFKGLKKTLPEADFKKLLDAHMTMELDLPPDLVSENIEQVLNSLKQQYQLCIISDAVFTPGKVLRKIIEHYKLDTFFDAFLFSDEVGHSKPHPLIFDAAAKTLGVRPSEFIHIGDRQHNDVFGAQSVGSLSILFTQVRNQDKEHTTAHAICDRFEELPNVIAGLGK